MQKERRFLCTENERKKESINAYYPAPLPIL
nr:MAG TPA: hypothetical protein [Caudoviricetes sp.]